MDKTVVKTLETNNETIVATKPGGGESEARETREKQKGKAKNQDQSRSQTKLIKIEEERKEKYDENIDHFRLHKNDTGSAQLQIVRLSARITQLTEHFKKHKADHHSRRGLMQMVSRRRKLLDYIKERHFLGYQDLLQRVSIRK